MGERAAEPVRLAVVRDEVEAEMLCGMLRAEGIVCTHRQTSFASGGGEAFPGAMGPREVLVRRDHYERATSLQGGEHGALQGD